MPTPRPKVLRGPRRDDTGRIDQAQRQARRAQEVAEQGTTQVFVQDEQPAEGPSAWAWLQTGIAGDGVSLWFYEPEGS